MTNLAAEPLNPAHVRYIKLGAGGAWEASALDHGRLEWGSSNDPHEAAVAADWEGARAAYLAQRRAAGTATGYVRELRDFYTLGADTLWITFARDHLWWAFAEPEVIFRGQQSEGHASRYRRTIGIWRNTDLLGRPLAMTELSTKLTKVASYQQTMCSVEAAQYAVRRINGIEEPAVALAKAHYADLVGSIEAIVRQLHWADFELLVDLLFARAGWRRVSTLGGTMKNNDLIVEQAATGERASVQVKSAADQRVFDTCVAEFEASPLSNRFFFVCHSPRLSLSEPTSPTRPVHLWTGSKLAEMVVAQGLSDWLIARAA